jgi:hypothetical protein
MSFDFWNIINKSSISFGLFKYMKPVNAGRTVLPNELIKYPQEINVIITFSLQIL